MPIFQDENGLAIKFFIQKDIPQEIQAEVCETIASLGGRVESKVPRAGYVLTQPGTTEEERLRLCWASSDRPERFFVPYTYVEACKIHGILLKQIFVHQGSPIRMNIDSSIANVNVRAALSTRIMHSGGDPTASAQSARVILADPNTEVFQHLVKTYQGETDKYVESYLWVKKCIDKGSVIYTPVVYKNPGGRRPGEERTQFTEQDEDNLCNWIAAKIPYKETGGRTGNRLYQQLCEMVHDPEYAWVTRHTWQSWRERYKKNSQRLDKKIAQVVEEKKPAHGEKGQYGYVRKPEEKPKRSRKKKIANGETTDANGAGPSNEVEEDMDHLPVPVLPNIPGVLVPVQEPANYAQLMYPPNSSSTFSQAGATQPGPVDVAAARENAPEEEMEDGEEATEWGIRVNNATPPSWAKRRSERAEEEEPAKRPRISRSPERNAPREAPVLHVIDKAIQEVAEECRFTIGEVQEYYDKCGDVERTKNRFKKMRELLTAFNDEEERVSPDGMVIDSSQSSPEHSQSSMGTEPTQPTQNAEPS